MYKLPLKLFVKRKSILVFQFLLSAKVEGKSCWGAIFIWFYCAAFRGRCGPVDKLKQIYVIIPSETRENGRVEPSTEKALSDRRIPTRIDIATVLDVLDSPLTPSRIWVKDSAAAAFCAIFSCRLPMPNIKLASRSRSLPKDEAAGSWKLNKRNYKHFALVLSSSSPPCPPSICQFISRA